MDFCRMTNVGRKRGGRFTDRPPNVEINTQRGRTYLYYVFPDGRRASLGCDAKEAYDKATALNGHFAQKRTDLDVQRLIRPRPKPATRNNPSLTTLIAEFRQHVLKDKKLSDRSRSEAEYRLKRYEREWPTKTVREFETFDIAQFLEPLTNAAWIKHRKQLLDLFQFAGHRGYISQNPVAITLVKTEGDKVRHRHTLEGLTEIRAHSPEWMQRAIDVALYSLQRREDVVLLQRSQVSVGNNTITVLQRKTRNYNNPVYLEIVMAGELRQAVASCLASPMLCPYLIHTRPRRMTRQVREAKPHHFCVTPDHLTREFSRLRDECGAYAELEPAQRPTFHEIRSLGVHLYEQSGFSREYIMALSGHATDAMFERYRKDHQQSGPRRVEAGLLSIGDA